MCRVELSAQVHSAFSTRAAGLQQRQGAATTYISLSDSVITAIFPRGPGLAGTRMSSFWISLELRITEVVVTTGPVRRAKLQSNHHHQ